MPSSPRSTPIESTGAPLTSGKSPAQPSLAPGAQATGRPARPASEQVPATAQAVTISMDLGGNQVGHTPPKPVTITDRARVSELKALINGLALFPPGTFGCPAGFGCLEQKDFSGNNAFVCTPSPNLCIPSWVSCGACSVNADCPSGSGECVDAGGMTYCAVPCVSNCRSTRSL